MLDDWMLMLAIINPFAQMLYLTPLMRDTERMQFIRILMEGVVLTYIVCLGCAFVGEWLLFEMFQVRLAAMRVFGGLINLQLAWMYVMKGPEGVKLFSGSVSELAQQIALPIMIGAGVIWISMRIGRVHSPPATALIILCALAVNLLAILSYHYLLTATTGPWGLAVVKYLGMAMRLNALIVGAISIEMILGGVLEYIGTVAASPSVSLHAPTFLANC